jgi:HAE1 family hydrophobic/amphiphilic exporter-1/multidrug efflux pump
VGRLFREFGVVIGAAVLISAFVSLTLTPMLNAYLMKGGEQKKSKFYNLTEPYFKKNNSYAGVAIMGKNGGVSLSFSLFLDFFVFII